MSANGAPSVAAQHAAHLVAVLPHARPSSQRDRCRGIGRRSIAAVDALMLRIARLACFAAAIAAVWAALLQRTTEESTRTAVLLVRFNSVLRRAWRRAGATARRGHSMPLAATVLHHVRQTPHGSYIVYGLVSRNTSCLSPFARPAGPGGRCSAFCRLPGDFPAAGGGHLPHGAQRGRAAATGKEGAGRRAGGQAAPAKSLNWLGQPCVAIMYTCTSRILLSSCHPGHVTPALQDIARAKADLAKRGIKY